MRFLTDENIATSVVAALRNAGHDVIDVKEQGWQGMQDSVLVEHALKDSRIVITHDKDFLYQHRVSVVLVRLPNQAPAHVRERLLTFLESHPEQRLQEPTLAIVFEDVVEFRVW